MRSDLYKHFHKYLIGKPLENCSGALFEMPYAALTAVKWLSKMLTLITVDMAVSGPKLATFVNRLTCKWPAPLCIMPNWPKP